YPRNEIRCGGGDRRFLPQPAAAPVSEYHCPKSDREAAMVKRASAVFLLSLLATCGFAKDKTKNILPAYVLQAKTVAVVIDPNAGLSIDDPRANEVAQKDVEAAFLKWGKFEPVSDPKTADLIVMVRKGNSRLMDESMP